MNLLREYIRELVESEYRRIQDESDQCTNATVLAIAPVSYTHLTLPTNA